MSAEGSSAAQVAPRAETREPPADTPLIDNSSKSTVMFATSPTISYTSLYFAFPSAVAERRVIGRRPLSPDGGWGWMVVLGSFFIHVFADGFVYSFGVLVAELLTVFPQGGHAVTGWIISLLLGLTLGIGPIASAVTNMYGCRFATIVGACIASFGCGISYFADSLAYLMLSVGLVMGIGFGLMYCPAIVVVTMYFERRRGFATGIAVCGAGFGTLVFAPLSQWMIDEYGWRGTLLIYSALILNCAVCGALFRPLDFEDIYDDEMDERQIEHDQETITHSRSRLASVVDPEHRAMQLQPVRRLTNDPHEKIDEVHVELTLDNGITIQLEAPDAAETATTGKTSLAHKLLAMGNADVANGDARGQRTQSHHMLPQSPIHNNAPRPSLRPSISHMGEHRVEGRHHRSESHGYMNIKDVFYAGSTQRLAEYNASPSTSNYYRSISSLHPQHIGYRRQASHIASIQEKEIVECDSEGDDEQPESCAQFKRVIGEMADMSLLKSLPFLLFTISNFLTSVGLNPPLVFLPDKARAMGIDQSTASLLLSIFGMSNTAGRLLFGFISDRELPCRWGKNTAANRLWMYNVLITMCGLCTIWVCFTDSALGLMVYAALFGISISYIYDTWHDYDYSFMFCGVALLVSGVMLYVLPCFSTTFAVSNKGDTPQ